MAWTPEPRSNAIRRHRFPALWILAILALAVAGEAGAQQQMQRFAAADPPSPEPFAASAASELPLPGEDEVFYTPGRVVLSILGTLVGTPVGALVALELTSGPWDRDAAIGGMIGGGAGAAAGLLVPGPTPESAVVPTLLGAAAGFLVGIWGLNEPVEPAVPLFAAAGAQIGFAWAAVRGREGT